MEPYRVEALVRGRSESASLTLAHCDGGFRLTFDSSAGSWTSEAADVFGSLRVLRTQLDDEHILIGVAGARPNVWASGMQRDMGCGHMAYVLTIPQPPGRPPTVQTLAPTPCTEVGTVVEQDAFQGRWHAHRRP